MNNKYGYLAFISYRHLDNVESGREWATWLHKELETYEIPSELVGTLNDRGEVIPEKIYPVFRDELELPASSDLSNSITTALDKTNVLVVLCSPNSAKSKYVGQEISYFKQIGCEDKIIAAIIDGEPNVSIDASKLSHGYSIDDECFHKALQFDDINSTSENINSKEPIAADLRIKNEGKYEQGWTNDKSYSKYLSSQGILRNEIAKKIEEYKKQRKLMLLKIVAAILGINLNRLTKRDEEYQLKKLQSQKSALKRWLAALAVVAIIALFSAYFAYRNQVIADAASTNAKYNLGVAFSSAGESAIKNNNYVDTAIYSAKAISNISGNSEEKINLYELFRHSKQENRIQWRAYPNEIDTDILSIDLSYDGKYSFTLVHQKILVKEYESDHIVKEINLRASDCNGAELLKVGNKLKNIVLFDKKSSNICIIKFNEDNGIIIGNSKYTVVSRYFGGTTQDIELSPDESNFLVIDNDIKFVLKSSLYIYDSSNMKMLFHDENSWNYGEKQIITKQAIYFDNSRIIINKTDMKGIGFVDLENKKYEKFETDFDIESVGVDRNGHVFIISYCIFPGDEFASNMIAKVEFDINNKKLNIIKKFKFNYLNVGDFNSRLFFGPKNNSPIFINHSKDSKEVLNFIKLSDGKNFDILGEKIEYGFVSNHIKNIIYSSDGSKIFLVYHDHIEFILLESISSKPFRIVDTQNDGIRQLGLTYDDKYLVSSNGTNQISVRDAYSGDLNKTIPGSKIDRSSCSDKDMMFQLGKYKNEAVFHSDTGSADLLDIDSSKMKPISAFHCTVRFARNEKDVIYAVTDRGDGTLSINQKSGDDNKVNYFKSPFPNDAIHYEISNDGHYLVITNGYKFAIYNLQTSKPANDYGGIIFDYDIVDPHDHVESFEFIYDNNLLVSSQQGLYILNLFDKLTKDSPKHAITTSAPITYQVSTNGAYLVQLVDDGFIIDSLKDNRQINYEIKNIYGEISSLAINSTGKYLYIATIYGDIFKIDVSDNERKLNARGLYRTDFTYNSNDTDVYVNLTKNKMIHVRDIEGKNIESSEPRTEGVPSWLYESRSPDLLKIFIETNHQEVMLDEVFRKSGFKNIHNSNIRSFHYAGNNIYYITPDLYSKVFDVAKNKTLSTCKLISSLDEKDFFYYDSNFNHLVMNDEFIVDPISCDVLFDLRKLKLPVLHHIPIYKQISDELFYLSKDDQLCVVHEKTKTSCKNLLDIFNQKFNKMTIAKNNDFIALSSDDSVALIDHDLKSSKLLVHYEHVQEVLFSEDSKYLFIHADNSIFVYNLKDSDVVYFAKIDVGPCSGPFKFDEMTQQIIAYYGTSIRVFDVSLYFDKSKPIDEKIDLWLQSVTQHLGLKFLGAKYMYDKRQENSHADHVDKYYQDF